MKNGFLITLIILIFTNSCKDDPCLKGSGARITEVRDFSGEIENILLFDNLNLDIYIDSLNYIEISGGENVVNYIETKEDGTSLIFENKNKCNFLRNFDQDVSIDLHIAMIKSIEYRGSRNLTMRDTLSTQNFLFKAEEGAGSVKLLLNCSETAIIQSINGFTDITLYGKAAHTGYYNDGSSWIYSAGFQSKTASVETRSTGDCIVNVDSSLICYLRGIGNIQYIGEPDILIKKKDGKGSVFQLK